MFRKDGAVMRNREIQAKRIVRTCGEVQFPIRIGEEAYYRQGSRLVWTDKVKRILEIAADYVRFETTAYYYIIEREKMEMGQLREAA